MLKITFLTHIKQLTGLFIFMFVMAFIEIYYDYSSDLLSAAGVIFLFTAIFNLDVIFLHLRYWWINRNTVISFPKKGLAEFSEGKKRVVFSPHDIKIFELHLSRSVYQGSFGWGVGESYNYAFIILNDGEEIIITSLMSPDLIFPKEFLTKIIKIKHIRCWL